MQSSQIRDKFLKFFERQGHTIRPSSSLIPGDDPTLLFTNAGMVPFKKVFLGLEQPEFGRRATTSQKCVRAGGKHNDLEQVGHTARHHTFFEMLGNFSFGDYFKADAIKFAWQFITEELKIDPKALRVSVFHEDDEARRLWREISGLDESRIYGLGAKDNFWQMADTGPCGPCTEIYVDLAHVAKDWKFPKGATGEWTELNRETFSRDAFVEGAEAGRFLEIWNLVFMQFDRQADGTLVPLPKPSVDTGAGLERIAAVMQGVSNNFDGDLFTTIISTVARELEKDPSKSSDDEMASLRVIADHSRATAFLLADGVFPSNEGRGYVLRRILRRAVRHAWLLGRSEPLLFKGVEKVIELMGDTYPELRTRADHLMSTTKAEEQRFLDTIEGGMKRFDELAPIATTQGSTEIRGTISGEDAFKLYDTYGFPIDLTELMARERGYTVDIAGFETALDGQRKQSQADRKSRKLGVAADDLSDATLWETDGKTDLPNTFVGYDSTESVTEAVAVRRLDDDRVAIILRESPFYAESGGQISDEGEIIGEGWRVNVQEVRKVTGNVVAIGKASGKVSLGNATARIPRDRRLDTERNHTATHLLHAALRQVLGEHVHQAGSLVAPDRLRFDFTHHGPMTPEQTSEVEDIVNHGILTGTPLNIQSKSYKEAIASGAMALFGEKYGDVVRVVNIPGLSTELCGGTHVRNTGEIGLFKITSETGVAAGVRRIEAVTGPRAYELVKTEERILDELAETMKSTRENVSTRVRSMVEESANLRKRIEELESKQIPALLEELNKSGKSVDGVQVIVHQFDRPDPKYMQEVATRFGTQFKNAIAVFVAPKDDNSMSVVSAVTPELVSAGVSAADVLKKALAPFGGKGGGRPNVAIGGLSQVVGKAAIEEAVSSMVRSSLQASTK